MANILIVSGNLKDWEKNSGGVERTATLAEALTDHKVTFLCFAWTTIPEEKMINNNIKYVRVGIEDRAVLKHKAYIRSEAKNNHDVTVDAVKPLLKKFSDKLSELAKDADLVILDHFSAAPLVEDLAGIVPIVYNSHNAEIVMGRQLYPNDKVVLDIVKRMERIAIENSVAMTYCSNEDAEKLEDLYSVPGLTKYIPNGTVMQPQTDPEIRIKSRDIIFVGSGHPPNGVAAKRVLEIAKMIPDYNFIVCGKASGWIANAKIPKNVSVLGQVDDATLDKLFKESFAFINPMDSGSGTHLKMMKALSYGIPIISSPVGARGFTDEEIAKTMFIIDSDSEAVGAVEDLTNPGVYRTLSNGGYALSKRYDWETIKAEYAAFIDSVLKDESLVSHKTNKAISDGEKKKVLVYSIVRNIGRSLDKYHSQLRKMVHEFSDHEFYLSIYENDSTDDTKSRLLSKDWSFFSGVSIITENIGTEFFGPVKDAQRVENLSKARNKAVEAAGFIDKVDYVLMVEGDVTYDMKSVRNLLNFKDIEPDFDVVSSVSIRENGTHYDWWATRTGAEYNPSRSELDVDYKRKTHGKYYSTSNGLCLYRAEGFQKGARHHWINTVTKEADCEMVVVCQNFAALGYKNVYISYQAFAYHHR